MESKPNDRRTILARSQRCALGGVEAELDETYRLYRDSVWRYVSRTFGVGPPDPDDVVQEAFERYANAAPASVLNPRAFLIRSAHNFVIDQKRKQHVRTEFTRNIETIIDDRDNLDAERVMASQQRWAILKKTIEDLDERSRDILIMNRLQDLSCAEIARRRNCSATLIKTILARALVACHHALAEADTL